MRMYLGGIGLHDVERQNAKVEFFLSEISIRDEFIYHGFYRAANQSDFIQCAAAASFNPSIHFQRMDVKDELQELMVEITIKREDGCVVEIG